MARGADCRCVGDLGRRLGEIWHVLRPGGLLQATVLSTRDANYGIGRAIAPDTFVIDRVERKGHPHCYCDAATLVALLTGFDLLTLSRQLQERDPARTTGISSPNAAAESALRGKSTIRRLIMGFMTCCCLNSDRRPFGMPDVSN